ncbi:MAG TPA: hypothetical protein PK280_17440 [Planctomycetota bacterium]|nr:hypothetical protein [Planctomycetota bacterium]
MSSQQGGPPEAGVLGRRAARLLGAIELRLVAGAVLAVGLLALAGLFLLAELLAAGLAFGPGWLSAAAERAGPLLYFAVLLAAVSVLLPLVRRPGRVYLASLAERAGPELSGQLVTLAEFEAGRSDLAPGAAELLAGRVESVLERSPLDPGRAAAEERPWRLPAFALGSVLAIGLGLAVLGGGAYLGALGELCGLGDTGPTRIADVQPGDVALDEGAELPVSCRVGGRRPGAVFLVSGSVSREMLCGEDGLWRAGLVPRGAGSYRVEAEARSGRVVAGPFELRIRPRPLARVEKVVYRYPAYTGLAPRESDSPELDCLAGAQAELGIAARGPVESVELRLDSGPRVAARPAGGGRWFCSVRVERVGAYSLWVAPQGGGAAREVAAGRITARADLAPTAAALARKLPDGRVAIDYRVADDYRLGPARMVFVVGGRRRAYEVPGVDGRRESQGAVLVPSELLASAAAADGIVRYRLEAADTRSPEPNRASSPDQEFRAERESALAMAGPVLEKPPLQMGGSHGRPEQPGGGSGASSGGQATRPLESLYKPEDAPAKPPSDPAGGQGKTGDPDDPYLAPSGGDPEDEPPARKPDGGRGPGESGAGDGGGQGGVPEQPKVNTPDKGGAGTGQGAGGSGEGGDTRNTPGGRSSGGGNSGTNGGGDGGGSKPVGKPPTGSETGVGQGSPEQVIPGKVNMDVKPGERTLPVGGAPPPLRTDWGGQRRVPAGAGSGSAPGEVRAPDGRLQAGPAPAPDAQTRPGGPAPGRAPVPAADARYRRYINDYLEAMAAEGQRAP